MKRPVPEHIKEKLRSLHRWGNMLRGYYGVPIWLVGSALSGSNPKPRDWDVRVILSDQDFARRFGSVDEWRHEGGTGEWTDVRWKWSDECVKNSKQGAANTGLNIDFQIYPRSHARLHYPAGLPRLRIDTRGRKTL